MSGRPVAPEPENPASWRRMADTYRAVLPGFVATDPNSAGTEAWWENQADYCDTQADTLEQAVA